MIQAHFIDIQRHVTETIRGAKDRIEVAMAWFTNESIFESLLDAARRGVNIRLLLLDDAINRCQYGLDFGRLIEAGASIRMVSANKKLMHNKFCIVDGRAITGSHNWTNFANENDENIVIIDDIHTVNSFSIHFQQLFSAAGKDLALPYTKLEADVSTLAASIRVRMLKAETDKIITAREEGEFIRNVLLRATARFQHKIWSMCEKKLANSSDKVYFIANSTAEEVVKGRLDVYPKMLFGSSQRSAGVTIDDHEFSEYVKSAPKPQDSLHKYFLVQGGKFYYIPFPRPMIHKESQKRCAGILVFGIVKEIFYEGWDPQVKGKAIMKLFFA